MTVRALGRLAEDASARFADHDALWFEGTWHRSSELAERSRRAAAGLVGLGVAPGDRVVVLMANCPEVSIAYTACWRAGAVATPVVFLVTAPELRHVLADSEAVAAVTTPEFLPKVLEAAAGIDTLRHVLVVGGAPSGESTDDRTAQVLDWAEVEAAAPDLAGPVDRAEDDLAALLYTGGTTGRSKGVMLSHANLWTVGQVSSEAGYVPGLSSTLLPLPLSHAFGLIVSVVGMHNPEPGRTVLMRWFDPAGWLRLAAEHRVARSALVPSMLGMVLAQDVEAHDLSALRYVTVGAAPLARELADELERRVPSAQVLEGYGCTESSAVIAANRPGRRPPRHRRGAASRASRCASSTTRASRWPTAQDGEIVARGPGHHGRLLALARRHREAVVEGWLHTGDVGRLDRRLPAGGGPQEGPHHPRRLQRLPARRGGRAGRAPGGGSGRRGGPAGPRTAVRRSSRTCSSRPAPTATVEELQAHAKAHLSAVKYPREIHLVDAVPLTSVGKLDRKALRARATP